MAFLEKIAKHKRVENPSVDAFVASAQRNIEALQNGQLTRRTWAKETGSGFVVKFGKLEGTYDFASKEEVIEVLHEAIADARVDEKFRGVIEAAYGAEPEKPAEEKPKRGYNRRKKDEQPSERSTNE